MSGAVVFAAGAHDGKQKAVGVISTHHRPEGKSALTVVPITAVADLAAAAEWWQQFGVVSPDALPILPRQRAQRGSVLAESPGGWPLAEVRDPFALEVHQPVQPDHPQPGLPALPTYVLRDHDTALGSVVQAAAAGRSGTAVLVGGSSTGKTRACWEALQLLRDQPGPWRLWHPIDPSRPDAALRELPRIGPRTVVWLNEAQLYLEVADGGLGERVAAGLRELLRDPARAPVLVLATLWPQFWDALTARPYSGADPHAQARELLTGHDITVPTAFTALQLQQLCRAGDARLAQAAAGAQDGQVIQFLAGAPELLARYRNAHPAAAALIHAAMDARRLGMRIALPRAFLEAAAPGYLTDTEWDALSEDWLEQALAYTSKGVRGLLTRIRPRPARSGATGSSSQDSDEQLAGGHASTPGGPLYRLADYLDQHGRTRRKGQIPPADFWAAAADHAFPGDLAAFGDAAHARGLYRAAAQLHKNAAACGDSRAVHYLSNPPRYLRNDVRSLCWAADHVHLDYPYHVADLLNRLREAGAHEQAATLLHRDPAAHVRLDNPGDVADLLNRLREAGAHEQATALADRAAAHVPLDNPGAVAQLLNRLREAGAHEQATALADRAAAHVYLDYPDAVARLLFSLLRADADEQAATLADHAVNDVPLDNPGAVAQLLDALLRMGGDDWAAVLLHRDPAAHVRLDNPGGVARLLDSLRKAGADEQTAALLHRDPAAHVSLDNSYLVTGLLTWLREAGAHEQATALADRVAAHVRLDDPGDVASVLDSLREAGADEQTAALLHRDPAARVRLDDPDAVARLLDKLRRMRADEQVSALLHRDPAAHVRLDDPGDVASVLDSLREAGADEQTAALLHRDPAAHVRLDNPGAVASVLDSLREAGADEQTAALLHRDPAAHVRLDNPDAVAWLLNRLREAGAHEQAATLADRAAAHVPLDNPDAVARLLNRLREAGAHEQTATLADRLPGVGMFWLFREQRDPQDQFRFGREADGSPANPWNWDDLD